MLEERVRELKEIIAGNDGRNAADLRFVRAVDELVSEVFDNVSEIKRISSRALFDLFVIKVLYVGRQSRHADVVEYLGEMLEKYLFARELFPADANGKPRRLYYSDMLDAEKQPPDLPNVFEGYRMYADGALFLAGMFSATVRRKRPSTPTAMRRRSSTTVDAGYYVTTGKTMYRMSAQHDHAECGHGPRTLEKLAEHFEVYVDALSEMSERYIMGFDRELIADKMLDAFNRHRESAAPRDLANARRYAELLSVDQTRFPG